MKYGQYAFLFTTLCFTQVVQAEKILLRAVSLASRDEESFRASITDPRSVTDAAAFELLKKKARFSLVASVDKNVVWDGTSHRFLETSDALGEDSARPSEQNLTVSGKMENGALIQSLDSYIEMPSKATEYKRVAGDSGPVTSHIGKWEEKSSWGDGKETVMLWQFVGLPENSNTAKDGRGGTQIGADLAFLKLPASDVKKLEKVPNPENAITNLVAGKALWRRVRLTQALAGTRHWAAVEGKVLKEDGREIVNERGLNMEISAKDESGKSLKVKLAASGFDYEGESESDVVLDDLAPTWKFILAEGQKDFNVIAYRQR